MANATTAKPKTPQQMTDRQLRAAVTAARADHVAAQAAQKVAETVYEALRDEAHRRGFSDLVAPSESPRYRFVGQARFLAATAPEYKVNISIDAGTAAIMSPDVVQKSFPLLWVGPGAKRR